MLVLVSLAAGALPTWHPEWNAVLTWTVGLGAAVLFFVSILLHELSHALVAKAYGIPVRSITLFLFGGMANIEQEPGSAKVEALMAAVGPITSIAIGLVFTFIAGTMVDPNLAATDPEMIARHMGPVATLFAWLGPINIVLGIFNLLPGFPLDGGRILRALIWGVTKDLERATRWASMAGQTLAWFFIIAGIGMAFGLWVPFFGTGFGQGLWLAFIGWFLNVAATASYRQLLVRGLLEDVPVSRLTRRRERPIEANDSVSVLVEDYIMPTGEKAVPVLENGRIIGIARPSDVRKIDRQAWHTTPIADVIEPLDSRCTVAVDDDAYEVFTKMGRESLEEIVVLDKAGEYFGLLRREDIARWLELQSPPGGPHRSFHERTNP